MGKRIVVASAIPFCLGVSAHAGPVDDIDGLFGGGKAPRVSGTVAYDAKIVSGLKEPQERKIRTDPAARVTYLLTDVFGKK